MARECPEVEVSPVPLAGVVLSGKPVHVALDFAEKDVNSLRVLEGAALEGGLDGGVACNPGFQAPEADGDAFRKVGGNPVHGLGKEGVADFAGADVVFGIHDFFS